MRALLSCFAAQDRPGYLQRDEQRDENDVLGVYYLLQCAPIQSELLRSVYVSVQQPALRYKPDVWFAEVCVVFTPRPCRSK